MAASLLNCIMKQVSRTSYKSSGVFWLTKALKILCLPPDTVKMTEKCLICQDRLSSIAIRFKG
jgi:hypothetical protein